MLDGDWSSDVCSSDLYPKSCRFVRKEQNVVIPAKVDIDGDSPVPNKLYYQLAYSMDLEGKALGELIMLLPAAAFELAWEGMAEIEAQAGEGASEEQSQATREPAHGDQPLPGEVEPGKGEEIKQETPVEAETAQSKSVEPVPKFNLEKHKKRVDRLLEECQGRVENEIGALIGADIKLTNLQNIFLSKEDLFYDNLPGRQICADMEVVGELQDRGYLFLGLKDAIRLGGILIMLPEAELENVVSNEDFNDDVRDAYGEVANIISGVYTAIFEEQYTKKLRFIRKEMHDIQPMKVDIEADQPIPNISYYVSAMTLLVEGTQCGRLQMVFPAAMLQLEEKMVQDEVKSSEGSKITQKKKANHEVDQGPAEITPQKNDKQSRGDGASLSPTAIAQLDKHKKRIDKLLVECQSRMTAEVSALLGTDVQFCNLENSIVGKEEFFFEDRKSVV
jgi:hypothetical protein